ncbi:DNA polymerase III subunit delta' [Enterococcus sp. CSURQ0835]|uniref:DNA polymerase III subunit delta' n=1 Tax=Enterococcus sp. CSURQ0835 TaxID=2681394 RepID=UPI00135A5E7C
MENLTEMQPVVFRQLQNSFTSHRLAHAYLFEGDQGTGKEVMAQWFAQHLFCTNLQNGYPCGKCNNCVRIKEQEHPDVFEIKPEGQTIKVDQMRALQSELSKSGFETNKKVVIIQKAETMNVNSANSLLKFLEEPPQGLTLLLLTQALGKILPTIRSRCQVIHFQALSAEKLQQRLLADGITLKTAELLASLTNSYAKAVEFSNDEWFNEARQAIAQWFDYLSQQDLQAFIYVQKKLIKLFKEKDQQALAFEILRYYVKETRDALLLSDEKKALAYNRLLEEVLLSGQKLAANVAFQNVAEQLTLHAVKLHA